MDDIFAGEIAESFDILGQFNANGCRILEKALVVAVVASHVQRGAVVPVLLIVGNHCACLFVSVISPLYAGGMLGRRARPCLGAIESMQEASAGIERERER